MNKKFAVYGLIGLLAAGGTVALAAMTHTAKVSTSVPPAIADTAPTSHTNHVMDGMAMSGMSHDDQNSSHHKHGMVMDQAGKTESAQVRLTAPGTIAANQPVTFTIAIQDSKAKAIATFDTFQEKLMHLIVVSDDLQVFQHLHPTYKGDGRFVVQAKLPQAGSYALFADYKPAGQPEAVAVLQTSVPGTPTVAPTPSFEQTKTVGDTEASLKVSEPTLKAGQEVTLTFNLKDAASQRSLQDLKPYLGEQGHLVILKQASPLTRADYIHAHPMRGTPAGTIAFMTAFPKPGTYKLWGQFNRNGNIVVAAFWVNVF